MSIFRHPRDRQYVRCVRSHAGRNLHAVQYHTWSPMADGNWMVQAHCGRLYPGNSAILTMPYCENSPETWCSQCIQNMAKTAHATGENHYKTLGTISRRKADCLVPGAQVRSPTGQWYEICGTETILYGKPIDSPASEKLR